MTPEQRELQRSSDAAPSVASFFDAPCFVLRDYRGCEFYFEKEAKRMRRELQHLSVRKDPLRWRKSLVHRSHIFWNWNAGPTGVIRVRQAGSAALFSVALVRAHAFYSLAIAGDPDQAAYYAARALAAPLFAPRQ